MARAVPTCRSAARRRGRRAFTFVEILATLMLLTIVMPTIIAGFRTLFSRHHPDEPQPTEAEVMGAFESAFRQSLATDQAWLAAHPPRV